jgi:hypothetical protein
MRVAGGLLVVGALVNLVGLERRRSPGSSAGDATTPGDPLASPSSTAA